MSRIHLSPAPAILGASRHPFDMPRQRSATLPASELNRAFSACAVSVSGAAMTE